MASGWATERAQDNQHPRTTTRAWDVSQAHGVFFFSILLLSEWPMERPWDIQGQLWGLKTCLKLVVRVFLNSFLFRFWMVIYRLTTTTNEQWVSNREGLRLLASKVNNGGLRRFVCVPLIHFFFTLLMVIYRLTMNIYAIYHHLWWPMCSEWPTERPRDIRGQWWGLETRLKLVVLFFSIPLFFALLMVVYDTSNDVSLVDSIFFFWVFAYCISTNYHSY